MIKIDLEAITIIAENRKDLLKILLDLSGFNESSFAEYMEISVEDLEKAPQWALNYLSDLENANLIHLGYVMKDTKTMGLMAEYNKQEEIADNIVNSGDAKFKPIIIKSSIISEAGSIKADPLINAKGILKRFNMYAQDKETLIIPDQ